MATSGSRPTFGHADPAAHWRRRLADGLAHDLGLVIAKAVHGQLAAGVPPADIVRQVALFGAQNRDGWGVGLTILTALANLLPVLPEEEAYLALFHGARRVAADCDGEAPRRERAPLASRPDPAALKRWLRRWTHVRHREAAERTLLTAIAAGASPAALADALLAAETERAFADTGHSLDFINKAFECLDLIGWEHAAAVLPTVVGQMVAARGAEESTAWRQPVDLVALCEEAAGRTAGTVRCRPRPCMAGRTMRRLPESCSVTIRPGSLTRSRRRSAPAPRLPTLADRSPTRRRCGWRASAMPTSTPTGRRRTTSSPTPTPSTRCSKRIGTADTETARHGACAAYCTERWRSTLLAISMCRRRASRARTASELDDLPADAETIRAALLDAFDRQRQVDLAARLVARHLTLGHSPQALIATLAHAVLREDAGFHAYQMLEAGVRQFGEWGDTDEGRHILIAVARYLAAHSPTERAALQTADIARRLMRGGELHQEAGAGSS